MVQLTLPKGSKVVKGKHHPAPDGAKTVKTGKVTIDYRPVHTYTLSNDIAYIQPKARVY